MKNFRVPLTLLGLVLGLLAGCGATGGVYHPVAQGQTLYRISRAYNVDELYLARINGITDPSRLRSGDRIFVPGATKVQEIIVPAVKPTPAATATPRTASIPKVSPPPSSAVTAPPVRQPVTVPPAARPTKPAKAPPLTVSTPAKNTPAPLPSRPPAVDTSSPQPRQPTVVAGRFLWPVRGTLLRRFGGGGGTSGKGLEIGVPVNTPVVAAAAGRVIYSGDGISSYGNLIIVKHDDTFFTVYGYNARNLVPSGTFVSKGEKIALAGTPPAGGKPRLYFEVRYGKEAVDPTIYLP